MTSAIFPFECAFLALEGSQPPFQVYVIYCLNAICDVIGENTTYERTKRTGSDQTTRVLHGVRSEPELFVTYEHLQKTLFSLSAQFNKNLSIYKHIEKADLGKTCVFLNKPDFP